MKHFLTTHFHLEGEFETKVDLTKIKLRLLQAVFCSLWAPSLWSKLQIRLQQRIFILFSSFTRVGGGFSWGLFRLRHPASSKVK